MAAAMAAAWMEEEEEEDGSSRRMDGGGFATQNPSQINENDFVLHLFMGFRPRDVYFHITDAILR